MTTLPGTQIRKCRLSHVKVAIIRDIIQQLIVLNISEHVGGPRSGRKTERSGPKSSAHMPSDYQPRSEGTLFSAVSVCNFVCLDAWMFVRQRDNS